MEFSANVKRDGKLLPRSMAFCSIQVLLNAVANDAAQWKDKQTSVYIYQKESKDVEERLTFFRIYQGEALLLFALEGTRCHGQSAVETRQHWLAQHPDLEKQSKLFKPDMDLHVWQRGEQVCLFNDKVFFTGTIAVDMDGWEQVILIERLNQNI